MSIVSGLVKEPPELILRSLPDYSRAALPIRDCWPSIELEKLLNQPAA
jgi:hypothetical protein